MATTETNYSEPTGGKEPDKYSGMREMNFALTPNVLICGAAGTVLGVILAMWGTGDVGIVAATAIVFGILSGIFGMFV